MKILKPCSRPGCPELVENGRCANHKPKANKSGQKSDQVLKWLNSARYRNSRVIFLKGKFCAHCHKKGFLEPATILDHIVPHCGNKELFWDRKNWQPLCKSCHDRKTATYDGGFGNK